MIKSNFHVTLSTFFKLEALVENNGQFACNIRLETQVDDYDFNNIS